LLDDVPMALPALARAVKLQGRAARAGFDWPGTMDVVDKIAEEARELTEASAWATSRTWRMTSAESTSSSVARKAAMSEVGRSEMKPTVSDRMILRPCGSWITRMVGSSVAKSRSLASTPGAAQRLKSVDLPALV
jgi:hypothetical protein